jgi:hypothetical protein
VDFFAGVVAEGKKYGVRNITAPISRNASKSRVSIDMSLPPFPVSAIYTIPTQFRWGLPLRHGVETTVVKRTAAPQALQSHPHSSSHAVPNDGFPHVFRTGRAEAAGRRQKRRHPNFVYAESQR